MGNLAISLISPVSISGPSGSVSPNSHLRRGVLAILARHQAEFIDYEFMQSALWDHPPSSARANIRTHIAQIKKDLIRVVDGDQFSVSSVRGPRGSGGGGGIKLTLQDAYIDILKFEELCSSAYRVLDEQPARVAQICEEAMKFDIID